MEENNNNLLLRFNSSYLSFFSLFLSRSVCLVLLPTFSLCNCFVCLFLAENICLLTQLLCWRGQFVFISFSILVDFFSFNFAFCFLIECVRVCCLLLIFHFIASSIRKSLQTTCEFAVSDMPIGAPFIIKIRSFEPTPDNSQSKWCKQQNRWFESRKQNKMKRDWEKWMIDDVGEREIDHLICLFYDYYIVDIMSDLRLNQWMNEWMEAFSFYSVLFLVLLMAFMLLLHLVFVFVQASIHSFASLVWHTIEAAINARATPLHIRCRHHRRRSKTEQKYISHSRIRIHHHFLFYSFCLSRIRFRLQRQLCRIWLCVFGKTTRVQNNCVAGEPICSRAVVAVCRLVMTFNGQYARVKRLPQ